MKTLAMIFLGAGWLLAGVPGFAAERELSPDLLARTLQRYPDADLNQDGKLTVEEFREFRRKTQAGGAAASARRATATTNTPSATDLQGRAPAFARITDDPKLPGVLLIGDSISVGYTTAVREALAGKANVHRPPTNCGNTSKGLKGLSQWLGDGHWDVIHFNFGLHDVTSIDDKPETPINDYEKNLRELVAQLRKTGATLVWCSTTPVPPARRAPLKPEDVVRYNEVAKKIMDENGIAIDDLYAFALPQLTKLQQPTNVHPTAEGFKVLAQQVAASIEVALRQRPAKNRSVPASNKTGGAAASSRP